MFPVRFRVWARKWVQNPVGSLVVVLLLVLLGAAALRGAPAWGGPGMSVFAVRAGDGFRIIDPDNESWDEASRLLQDAPNEMALIRYRPELHWKGWPAGLVQIVSKTVEFDGSEIGLDRPPGSRDRARAAFVGWLGESHRGAYRTDAHDIGAGDVRRVTVLWWGCLHNALIAGVCVVLVYSLAWIPQLPARLAATRRQRALGAGRCPHCGYSIVGLREPVCPECGKSWDVTAEDPPVDAGVGE